MSQPFDVQRLLPSFLAAAQSENFSAAARQLGVTPAAVSKNIRVLEEKLALRLFQRNTHSVVLTSEGKALLARVAPLWQALSTSLETLSASDRQPAGKVKVSIIPGFGHLVLMRTIPDFLARYPQIDLDISLEARVVNLVAEGFDAGIGNRVDPDSRLIARQLRPMKMIMAASPAYLSLHGAPTTPADLANHNCLLHRNPSHGRLIKWQFSHDAVSPELHGRLVSSRPDILISGALADLGIVCLADWYITPSLRTGALQPVLETFWPEGSPLWLYYPSSDLPPRVRVWVDFVLEHFRH